MWDLIVSVPDHCLSFYFFNKLNFFFLNATKISTPRRYLDMHRCNYDIIMFTYRYTQVLATVHIIILQRCIAKCLIYSNINRRRPFFILMSQVA